jgi:hypothetical protein
MQAAVPNVKLNRNPLQKLLSEGGSGTEVSCPVARQLQGCFRFRGGVERRLPGWELTAREGLGEPVDPGRAIAERGRVVSEIAAFDR